MNISKTEVNVIINQLTKFTYKCETPRHLELLWKYPTSSQTGVYIFEVNAINTAGHSVTFRQVSIYVRSMPSTLPDTA